MTTHPIQCRCGALRGQLDCSGTSSRVICYCPDCRAFANFLGRPNEILDEQGGTEIVQVAQPRLTLLEGTDHLAAVRLTDKGMIRWYASCCNTPLGNTLANPKVGFIGLIHLSLDHPHMDGDFGSSTALLNTSAALGDTKPRQRGLLRAVVRFLGIVLSTRIKGRYRNSPLFDGSGAPRTPPRILTQEELEALY